MIFYSTEMDFMMYDGSRACASGTKNFSSLGKILSRRHIAYIICKYIVWRKGF